MSEYGEAVVVRPSPAEAAASTNIFDEQWARWQAKGARHDVRVARTKHAPDRGDPADDRSHLGFSVTALTISKGPPRSTVFSGAGAVTDGVRQMFRPITTVRRGTASDLGAAWVRYPTIEAARAGASALVREDRVLRVMVVRNEIARTLVEWSDR